jgi:hypothetical protein
MNSKELFSYLGSAMPTMEYLFFKWSGGGDDWSGFEFVYGNSDAGRVESLPVELNADIQAEMMAFTLFEELSMTINCTDQGYSEGVLLIALKPLSDLFEDDSVAYLSQDKGFKGFAVAGKNHEEISGALDI